MKLFFKKEVQFDPLAQPPRGADHGTNCLANNHRVVLISPVLLSFAVSRKLLITQERKPACLWSSGIDFALLVTRCSEVSCDTLFMVVKSSGHPPSDCPVSSQTRMQIPASVKVGRFNDKEPSFWQTTVLPMLVFVCTFLGALGHIRECYEDSSLLSVRFARISTD